MLSTAPIPITQADQPRWSNNWPSIAVHGVVRWQQADLRDELQQCFGVALHERSIVKVLAKFGYRNCWQDSRHPGLTKKPRGH